MCYFSGIVFYGLKINHVYSYVIFFSYWSLDDFLHVPMNVIFDDYRNS